MRRLAHSFVVQGRLAKLDKSLDFQVERLLFSGMGNSRSFLVWACAISLGSQGFAHSAVLGEAFGYIKISIAAGLGNSKKTSLVSIPLIEDATISGKSVGRITSVTSTTISDEGAGWIEGQLSTPAEPHLIEITSGEAKGRMMIISTSEANTASTVTIAPDEVARVGDLSDLGIATGLEAGDTYRIRAVDTLSSFFGTPETTLIKGGGAANSADTITILNNGRAFTYFYNTAVTPERWTRVALGSPDASNTPIPPYAGVQYGRIANTPLEFIVTGKVPSGERKVSLKNSGATLLAPFWPTDQTLAQLAIQNTPNWRSGGSAAVSDTITLSSGGSASTFFHDGSSWKRVALGSPTANSNLVPIGTSILINKKGNSGGFATYQHVSPYDLQ